MDLFGLLDAPASVPTENHSVTNISADVDLFADADFVSAPSNVESGVSFETLVAYLSWNTVINYQVTQT